MGFIFAYSQFILNKEPPSYVLFKTILKRGFMILKVTV
jgi:hypothetical protein